MDYLLRDSFYTGVNYGRFDLDWLIQNLHAARVGDAMELALSRSAAFAFEDFLLSRYHMFLSVYLHHTAVAFDWMLAAFYRESRGEFEIPSEPAAFLYCDDVALMHATLVSEVPVPGSGLGTTVQRVPFQASIRGFSAPKRGPYVPTATQNVDETHETPLRTSEPGMPNGPSGGWLGLSTRDHVSPFQASTSVVV